MIIHDKMVDVIRNALVDYESATGLECQIRYADRLSAVVEVVLELAEDSNVGQVSISAVPAHEPVNLDENAEVIRKMLAEGVTVNEISERTGAHISTIYKIKKMQRDMEAK